MRRLEWFKKKVSEDIAGNAPRVANDSYAEEEGYNQQEDDFTHVPPHRDYH